MSVQTQTGSSLTDLIAAHQTSDHSPSVLPPRAPQISPSSACQITTSRESQISPSRESQVSPSTRPSICLPLDAQLKILAHLRRILQEMFRKFANDNSLLANPDSIWGPGDVDNLHKWWQKHQEDARSVGHDQTGTTRTLEQLSLSVSGTHLILVHKVMVPARTLTQFIKDAVTIARMMDVEPYASILSEFRDSAKVIADELDMRCDALHSKIRQQVSEAESSAKYSSHVVSQRSHVIDDYKRRIEQQRTSSAGRVDTLLSLVEFKCR